MLSGTSVVDSRVVCCNCSASRLPKAMTGSRNDFEEFNKQTDDAWDGGDDDLLLEAFNVRISRRDVQSAATQVSWLQYSAELILFTFIYIGLL